METAPQTPNRPVRSQESPLNLDQTDVNQASATQTNAPPTVPNPNRVPLPDTTTEDQLRAQLLVANTQLQALQNQLTSQLTSQSIIPIYSHLHRSREYCLDRAHPQVNRISRRRLPPIGKISIPISPESLLMQVPAYPRTHHQQVPLSHFDNSSSHDVAQNDIWRILEI